LLSLPELLLELEFEVDGAPTELELEIDIELELELELVFELGLVFEFEIDMLSEFDSELELDGEVEIHPMCVTRLLPESATHNVVVVGS